MLRQIVLALCALHVVTCLTLRRPDGTTLEIDPALLNFDRAEESLLNPLRRRDPATLADAGKEFLANLDSPLTSLDPVLIFPGLGGSGLDCTLNRKNVKHWYCTKKQSAFQIWVSISEMVVQSCFFDNLDLTYDPNNGTFSGPEGVTIAPIDFGGLGGVNCLDDTPGLRDLSTYFAKLTSSMEAVGYVAGVNLRAAPFDWRLSPQALEDQGFFDAAATLVEEMYAASGNTPVHLLGHSMGCPMIIAFLTRMEQSWVDTYVNSFISTDGPFLGAPKALRTVLSGDDMGINFLNFSIIDLIDFALDAKQFGGIIWLIPPATYNGTEPLVTTPSGSYTVNDYEALFNYWGSPISYQIYQDMAADVIGIRAPNTTTHCIYGTQVSTETGYYYSSTNGQPTVSYDPTGDGTVPEGSLEMCNNFAAMQTQPVTVQTFPGQAHFGIVEYSGYIQYVLSIVTHQ